MTLFIMDGILLFPLCVHCILYFRKLFTKVYSASMRHGCARMIMATDGYKSGIHLRGLILSNRLQRGKATESSRINFGFQLFYMQYLYHLECSKYLFWLQVTISNKNIQNKTITSLRVIPTVTSYWNIFVTNSDILCAKIWRGREGEDNSDEI